MVTFPGGCGGGYGVCVWRVKGRGLKGEVCVCDVGKERGVKKGEGGEERRWGLLGMH